MSHLELLEAEHVWGGGGQHFLPDPGLPVDVDGTHRVAGEELVVDPPRLLRQLGAGVRMGPGTPSPPSPWALGQVPARVICRTSTSPTSSPELWAQRDALSTKVQPAGGATWPCPHTPGPPPCPASLFFPSPGPGSSTLHPLAAPRVERHSLPHGTGSLGCGSSDARRIHPLVLTRRDPSLLYRESTGTPHTAPGDTVTWLPPPSLCPHPPGDAASATGRVPAACRWPGSAGSARMPARSRRSRR